MSETARDILGTLDFMTTQSYVDPSRVVLVGHSAGGIGSIAAASQRPNAIAAVFNFAGGRGSLTSNNGVTRNICSPASLVEACENLGHRNGPATFWLYAKNDRYFPPVLAHKMFNAFQAKAANATFIQLAQFETDGHAIFWKPAAMPLWVEQVGQILDGLVPTR